MTASRVAFAAALCALAAPLSAQQWGGGGAPSAARKATIAPSAADRRAPFDPIVPGLQAGPIPAPSARQPATGGGSYGRIAISNWGGSPPARPTRHDDMQGFAASELPSSSGAQWSSPNAMLTQETQLSTYGAQWSANVTTSPTDAPAPSYAPRRVSTRAQYASPGVVAIRGRVITDPNYRLPADSAEHAQASRRRP
ncbi:MAG: hypothetical protein HY084_14630 [Gemmatimonadetes bacterium]|nr:hypothetical protein [Gemmatimonadota bacterium]